MQERDKRILEKLKTLLRERIPLHQLILFASRARGDAELYSDFDVVVIVDGAVDEQTRDIVSDCTWEAGFADGLVIVPIVFGRQEWETGPERHSLLVKAVRAEGVPL